MKYLYLKLLFLIPFLTFAQQQNVTYSVAPSPFEENDNITLTFNGSSINEATWGVTDNALYLWSWSFDLNLSNEQGAPTNGAWENSNEANKLTYNSGNDTYSISFTPTTFYNRTGIGRIGFLIKAKNGDGDKKSQDILVDVGSFQVVLNEPAAGSTTIINSGGNLNIVAQNTGGNATYVLKEVGSPAPLNTQTNTSNYSFSQTNITQNTTFQLEVTLDGATIVKEFSVLLDPGSNTAIMPTTYQDGITNPMLLTP